MKIPTGESPAGATGKKRGTIKGFTRQSAARLRALVNQVDQSNAPPAFVTLTYRELLEDVRGSKDHIARFGADLKREHPHAVPIWKLEPQKRGAPHFHLIILGAPGLSVAWVADTWNRIAGDGDEMHRRWHMGELGRGNKPCVEIASSWSRVNDYISKYCVKLVESDAWHEPGRFWGVMNRGELSRYIQLDEAPITPAAAARVERVGRKWRAAQTRGRFVVKFDHVDEATRERSTRVWSFAKLSRACSEALHANDAAFKCSAYYHIGSTLPASLSSAADRKRCREILAYHSSHFSNARFTLSYAGSRKWTKKTERVLPGGLIQSVRAQRAMRTLLIPEASGRALVAWAQARVDADELEMVESSPAAPSVSEWLRQDKAWSAAVVYPDRRATRLPSSPRSVNQLDLLPADVLP